MTRWHPIAALRLLLFLIFLSVVAAPAMAKTRAADLVHPDAQTVAGLNLKKLKEYKSYTALQNALIAWPVTAEPLKQLADHGIRLFEDEPNVSTAIAAWVPNADGGADFLLILSGPDKIDITGSLEKALGKPLPAEKLKSPERTVYTLTEPVAGYFAYAGRYGTELVYSTRVDLVHYALKVGTRKAAENLGNQDLVKLIGNHPEETALFVTGLVQTPEPPKEEKSEAEDVDGEKLAEGSVTQGDPRIESFLFTLELPVTGAEKDLATINLRLHCAAEPDAGNLRSMLDATKEAYAKRWALLPEVSSTIAKIVIGRPLGPKHPVSVKLSVEDDLLTGLFESLVPKPEVSPELKPKEEAIEEVELPETLPTKEPAEEPAAAPAAPEDN